MFTNCKRCGETTYEHFDLCQKCQAAEIALRQQKEPEPIGDSLLRLKPFFALIGTQVNLYFDTPEKSAEFYEVMDRFIPEREKPDGK